MHLKKKPMKMPKRIQPLKEEGLVDQVISQLMSGKEAMIYVVQCGDAVRCAKVYKESNRRNFHQSSHYTEGRKTRNSRRARAMDKGSRYGRSMQEEAWQSTEVDMLCRLAAAGIRVPKFYNFFAGVLLMELITDSDGDVAPRLSNVILTRELALKYFHDLLNQAVHMLCAGIIHGDLSHYNILLGSNGPVIMDLPQAINAEKNNNAARLFKRDINNLTTYFSRFVPELSDTDYGSEIWAYYKQNKLTPDTVLSGKAASDNRPVNVDGVLTVINHVLRKQAALQRYKQERWTSPYSQH